MNIKKVTSILSASLLVFSVNATASFVQTDWETAGDNQVLLDTGTGIEWLNLENTRRMSVNDLIRATDESSASDDTFLGWRMPTENEVNALISSFFTTFDTIITTNRGESEQQYEQSVLWNEMIGLTYQVKVYNDSKQLTNTYSSSWGLYATGRAESSYSGTEGNDVVDGTNMMTLSNGSTSKPFDLNYSSNSMGVFLVRDASSVIEDGEANGQSDFEISDVSESFSIGLLGLAFMGFASTKRRKTSL